MVSIIIRDARFDIHERTRIFRDWRHVRRILTTALCCLSWFAFTDRVFAEPARFWISTTGGGPQSPSAPVVPNLGGATQDLYIWAQPATVQADLPFNAASNPFKVLRNFSLNVVSAISTPTVDFLNGQIIVYDTQRFQYVKDSTSTPALTSLRSPPQIQGDQVDKVIGLQGFSIGRFVGTGFGGTSCAGDAHCQMTGGVPAWKVASLKFQMVQPNAAAEIYLQLGENGINHVGQNGLPENSSLSKVVFGAGSGPEYMAGDYSQRNWTNPVDTPDLVVEPFLIGDYNRDGSVDAADYVVWRKGIPTTAGYPEWRMNFGDIFGGGSSAENVNPVPEPMTLALVATLLAFILVHCKCRGNRRSAATSRISPHSERLSNRSSLRRQSVLPKRLRKTCAAPDSKRLAIAIFFSQLLTPSIALATNYFWTGATNDRFVNVNNWVNEAGNPAGVVPGPGDLAIFVQNGVNLNPVNVVVRTATSPAGQFVNGLTFRNNVGPVHLFDGDAGPAFIQVGDNGIRVNSTAGGNVIIDPAIVLRNSHTWEVLGDNRILQVTREVNLEGHTLTIDGNGTIDVDATWGNGTSPTLGSIFKTGSGTLRLNAPTAFSGITVNNGLLIFKPSAVAGAGHINVNSNAIVALESGGNGLYAMGSAGQFVFLNGSSDANRAAFQFRNPGATDSRTFWNGNIGVNGFGEISTNGRPPGVFGQISGVVTGSGVLITRDSISLANANTFNGLTRVEAGRLTIDHVLALQNSTLHLASPDNGTVGFSPLFSNVTLGGLAGVRNLVLQNDHNNPIELRVGNSSAENTFSGVLSGSGSLTKIGNGVQILGGANTYTGGTKIVTGSVRISSDVNLGNVSGTLTLTGGALQLNGSVTSNRNVLLDTTGGVFDTFGFDSVFNGNVSGGGVLTKMGAGTLNLSGSNGYTGGTVIHVGTVNFTTQASLPTTGSITVHSGATLRLGVQGNGNFNFGSGGQLLTLNGGTLLFGNPPGPGSSRTDWNGNVSLAANSTMTSIGGPFRAGHINGTISGLGRLTIGAGGSVALNNSNSYTGGTTIENAGTLIISSDTSLGSGGLTFAGGGLFLANSITSSRAVTLNNPGGIIDTGGNNSTFSGQFTGTGLLTKNGTGTLTLTNTNNPYSGGTTINSGTLVVGSGASLGSGTLTFGGGTLRTSAGIGFGATVFLSNHGVIDTNGFDSLFVGHFTGGSSLTKNGGGTLTIGSVNNTYAGGTIVNGGTLSVSSDSSLGTGNLTLAGGTFRASAGFTLLRNVTLNSPGGLIDTDTNGLELWFPGFVTGNGSLTKIGNGMLKLTNGNSYTGGTFINSGSISVGADGHLGHPSGGLTFASGGLQMLGNLTSSRTVTLNSSGGVIDTNGFDATFNGNFGGGGALTKMGAGTLNLSGSNGYIGGTVINVGTVNFTTQASLPTTGNITVNPGATLRLGVLGDGTFGYGGEGQLLTLNGGTLMFGNPPGPGTSRTDWRGNVSLAANSTLTSIGGPLRAGQINGTISGAGRLTIGAGGSVSLTNANSYSGGTTIESAGTLIINVDANLGTGGLTFAGGGLYLASAITSNRTVMLNSPAGIIDTGGNNSTFSGQFTGAGAFTKNGGGTLTLSNASNTYSGNTTVNGGALKAVNQSAFGNTSTISIGQGAILDVSAISNFFLQSGRTLTGHGTVEANQLTIANGGELGGSLTVNGSVTNAGLVAPGNSPGITYINGDYVQTPNGILEIEVTELTPGPTGHDQLVINGSAALAGELKLIIDGFMPEVGDGIVVLTANTIFGDFGSVSALNLPSNVKLRPVRGVDSYEILFAHPGSQGCGGGDACLAADEGDLNADGVLDENDIPVFADALNDPIDYAIDYGADYRLVGDFDNNFRLDFDDIPGFVTALGGSGGMSEAEIWRALDAQLSVPEPSVISWVLVGGCVLLAARRRGFEFVAI
jgi:autotransporter-associated beta strand protein